jgi:hypothetical protein
MAHGWLTADDGEGDPGLLYLQTTRSHLPPQISRVEGLQDCERRAFNSGRFRGPGPGASVAALGAYPRYTKPKRCLALRCRLAFADRDG